MNITGYTKVYGIIADPIRHSFSPAMHNTAFEELGLDCVYVAFETPRDKFCEGAEGLKAVGVCGLNVSMPYKKDIIAHLDRISEAARMCQAVNTVVREKDGTYSGHITDGIGFVRALREQGFDIEGKKMVVLGKGGAATAICVQAALDGASDIWIFNRSDASANASLIRENTDCESQAYSITDLDMLKKKLLEADILVNATNVGMGDMADGCLIPDASFLREDLFVADIIYNPKETKLLAMAREAGCRTMNGIGMLLYQGAEAFRLWTGMDMPVEVVKRKVFPEL